MKKLLIYLILIFAAGRSYGQIYYPENIWKAINGIYKFQHAMRPPVDTTSDAPWWSEASIGGVKYYRDSVTGWWQRMGGGVLQVNTASGILGGPITTTGTVKADTFLLATKDWTKKALDSISLAAGSGDNWGSQVVQSDYGLLGTGVTSDKLKVDTFNVATRNEAKHISDSTFSNRILPYKSKYDSSYYDVVAIDTCSFYLLHFDGRKDTVNFCSLGGGTTGDNWGSQVAQTDYGIIGNGTSSSKLQVDTFNVSTRDYAKKAADSLVYAKAVRSVATNNGTGIVGGTITSTGTIAADTTTLTTRQWVDHVADSLRWAQDNYYVKNQNSAAQTGNAWINGNFQAEGKILLYQGSTLPTGISQAAFTLFKHNDYMNLADTLPYKYVANSSLRSSPVGSVLVLQNGGGNGKMDSTYSGLVFAPINHGGYNEGAYIGAITRTNPLGTNYYFPATLVFGFRTGVNSYAEGMRFIGANSTNTLSNILIINDTTNHGLYNIQWKGGRYADFTSATATSIGLSTTTDTTNYKPYVRNPSTGEERQFNYWPGGGGGGGGSTVTVGTYYQRIFLSPSNGTEFFQTDDGRDSPAGKYYYLNSTWNYIPMRQEAFWSFFDDFGSSFNAPNIQNSMVYYYGGSGANISGNFSNDFYVNTFSTGTTSTGYAKFGPSNAGGAGLYTGFKASTANLYYKIQINSVSQKSNLSDVFNINAGFQTDDNNPSGTGYYFRYDSVTSANWLYRNGNGSLTSTGVAFSASTSYLLEVFVRSDSVFYWINGTNVASLSTVSNTTYVSPIFKLIKTSGTTAITASLDYIKIWARLQSTRN